MAKTDSTENLGVELDEIKSLVSELKSDMMSGEDCNNQFYSIMQTLDGIVSSLANIEKEEKTPSDEFAILQTNILEVKKELAAMNQNIDETINSRLGELLIKLTEKVNRLEILTNNAGIDKTIIMDATVQLEKKFGADIKECADYLEKVYSAVSKDMSDNISEDISALGSSFEKTADNLKRSVIDIFTRIQEMASSGNLTEASEGAVGTGENIEMLKTGIYNLNVNTEQRFSKLGKMIEELELFSKLENFSRLKNLPAIGDLKSALNNNLSMIVEEYSTSIQNAGNSEAAALLAKNFKKNVYDALLSLLSNVSEYVIDGAEGMDNQMTKQDSGISAERLNDIVEIRNGIEELRDRLASTGDRTMELGEVVRECTKSIIENSEPDRLVIKELLADIKKNISVLQSGDEETDYTYSMQDIESDVAKIRIYLNELSQNGLSINSDNLLDELNNLVVMVDSIKHQLNKIDEADIADSITKMQDDMTSISTRINKLILTSDNSYNMIECTLKEFKLLSDEINSQIKSLSNSNKFKNLEESLESVKAALVESNNYNSVVNQSLVMLAEWVDNAGEALTNISEKQDKLNSIDEVTSLLADVKTSVSETSYEVTAAIKNLFEETNTLINESKPVDYSTTLELLDGKITEQKQIIEQQEERLNKLDEKLTTILEFVAKNDSSQFSSKLVEIDEKMERLNNSIEKLTSFINED